MDIKQFAAAINAQLGNMGREVARLKGAYDAMSQLVSSQRSITAEMDAIPGRRVFYTLAGRETFTLSDEGQRGQPISMLVSQDGPFMATHYPLIMWRPTQPTNADTFGLWRPVTPWPLPLQFSGGGIDGNFDYISISYEVVDAGSQRNLQNAAVPPLLSRPDMIVPLPVPTMFTPNSVVTVFPTYERIVFNSAGVPPTEGQIVVAIPGYRVVNL